MCWIGLLSAALLLALPMPAAAAASRPDIPLADFEGQTYAPWKVTGDAFGPGPARGTLGHQNPVSGYHGKALVNTYFHGDGTTGTLTSPPFALERKYINFLIGGGSYAGKTCMNLLIDGELVHTAQGAHPSTEQLVWHTWDVSDLAGRKAVLQIVDRATGGWGHVNVDHIVLSDVPKSAPEPNMIAARRRAEAQRKQALERIRNRVREVVFAVRQPGKDGHWYANFSYWSHAPNRKMYGPGGKLCVLNLATGKVRALVDDPKGGVRDPQMHYDGKKILFSYRKGDSEYYHLYEIGIDGRGLRQITDGPCDDFEPAYLPDGGIVFCSSRCNRWVNCFFVRVAVLYRCEADGSHLRMLSSNIEQDNTPWVLPDGRILHQRWEYIDRSQVRYHHLWTMNPDGTDQMVYYGNMHPSTVMIDAKPIPNSQKVVASFSPGHGRREHAGFVTVVDPKAGPDERTQARRISDDGECYDPYPLGDDFFLVARQTQLLLMDGQGRTNVLYELPAADRSAGLWVHEPRPRQPRPRERVVPAKINLAEGNGRVVLTDVYTGRNMAGVKRGEIKKLLVLEALPKPVNFSGGWEPITFGGSFTLERVLGTVPVEPDGSAYFELPPLRSLFFVALDENDLAVKRMQSFLTVQPGETFACVGCHEQRTTTKLPSGYLDALRREPSRIEPIADVPDVLDFPRDIQPILDKHCVACHDYDATAKGGPRSGGVILTGDHGGIYSHSYAALTLHKQFVDGRNGDGNHAPRTIGSSASPLLTDKLAGKHHGVKATPHERKLARLWIESAAAYPGTYAALGTGMIGATCHVGKHFDRQSWRAPARAIHKRCGACHKKEITLPTSPDQYTFGFGGGHIDGNDIRYRFDSNVVFNLTRPEKSLVLLAPLAREAGGYAVVQPHPSNRARHAGARARGTTKPHPIIFLTTADPDYQTILAGLRQAKAYLDEIKRFDMPGFRPNEHYIREMKLYGILPETLAPNAAIDCYQTDQAYWRSFWHKPVKDVTRR